MSKLRLGLEWFLNPDHVPLLVGQEKGWFAEAGLELELVEPDEHVDAIAELQSGALDVAVTEPVHLVEDRGKGHEVIGWARFLHTNGGVMYFSGRGIERPKDMLGKRLQYPGAPSALGKAIAKTMIEADGGNAGEEAIVSVDNGFFHTDALIEDKADLATLVFYNFEVIEARQRGYDAQFFALKNWGVPDFCQLILIATPEVLKQRQADLSAFLDVLRRGIDFIHQQPEVAQSIYDQRTGAYSGDGIGQAIYNATAPCFTHDFSMSAEYYDGLQTWMHRTGQIPHPLAPHDYWTNALAIASPAA
ncbi:MAG: ABC transporter substrate-binding protein [Cyanobacteria bacterium P01_F01_bin.42]